MTKHIAGLFLFTFIVGTSAAIAGLFYVAPEKVRVFRSYDNYDHCKRKKRKKRHRRPRFEPVSAANFMVTDAVLERKTGYLTTYHYVKGVESSPERRAYFYHFFVKDELGTNYLRSERVWSGLESPRLVSSFDWLSNIDAADNLYIMSDFSTQAPEFDPSLAVPVLIKAEK